MKKIISFLFCAMLFANVFGQSVQAEEVVCPKVYHVYTTEDELVSDEWYVVQKGAYLLSGSCDMARSSGTSISISGATSAVQDCDKVQLKLYVERSTSKTSGYTTYKSYSYSENNAHQIVREISNIPVVRGYYYRVRGVHSVTEGSTTETISSTSSPLSFI